MSLNHQFISRNFCLDSHLGEHIHDGLCPVTFLIGQPAHSSYAACTLTECRQHRYYWEQVRTIGCIHLKCPEWSTLHCYISFVSIQLGEACTRIHEYIHYGEVRLKRGSVKSGQFSLSEDCPCYQEVSRSTPVAFKFHICSLILLTSLDLEDHLCT